MNMLYVKSMKDYTINIEKKTYLIVTLHDWYAKYNFSEEHLRWDWQNWATILTYSAQYNQIKRLRLSEGGD